VLTRLRRSNVYDKLNQYEIVRQFVKYAMVGALNVALFLAIFNGLRETGLHIIGAYAAGFFTTNVVSFFLNKRWSFRDERRERVARQYLLFAFLTLVGFGLSSTAFRLLLIPLDDLGRLGENLAALGAIPISVMWNFTSYRLWAFNRRAGSA
jgi:putative flippase GtrA